MFTGIIKNLGTVKSKTAAAMQIKAGGKFIKRLKPESSVAVNGVCLTATKIKRDSFLVDIMPETWKKTMLGQLKKNRAVNLELPLKLSDAVDGHLVLGHVDGTAVIKKIIKAGNSLVFSFSAPKTLTKYLVDKGSVTINGIALTIISVRGKNFTVGIVPHTFKNTTFNKLKVGGAVNVEVDILAKYVYKFLKH